MLGDGESLAVSLHNFVADLLDEFGEVGVFDLQMAIDRCMGWATEVIGSRGEVDRLLLESVCSFDDGLWEKVRLTDSWCRLERRVYDISRRYLALAVEEVVRDGLSGGC